MTASAAELNAAIWERLYASGRGDLRYPGDVLVRLGAALLDKRADRRILDYGFGTGANLMHFASEGYELYGVETSEHACARAQEKLRQAGLSAKLCCTRAGQPLPFESGFFDVVYAWHVLYYNDRDGWSATLRELERVARAGGRVLVATAAPGDISQILAEPVGRDLYRSRVPGQEGCLVLIPECDALPGLFPGRALEIGEFGYRFGAVRARHWIVTYRVS
jgi:SAM-dependent methyltransferase